MPRYLVTRANTLGFGVLVVILLLISGLTWDRFSAARQAREFSQRSSDLLATVKDLNLAIRRAETGQRGYLLTGKEEYLAPYTSASGQIDQFEDRLNRLTVGDPDQQGRLRALGPLLRRKLDELAETIQLRRTVGAEAALAVVQTDVGRSYMGQIETIIGEITADEQQDLARYLRDVDVRGRLVRWLVGVGTVLALLGMLWAARMLNRAWRQAVMAEAEERTIALRLKTSLDSLSQGIGVFDADRQLTNWNHCFQVLLSLPPPLVRPGTSYGAVAAHMARNGAPLESEDELRHGRHVPGEPVTYERRRENGHLLEVRRTTMPDGGFVLTVSDMTRRAEAEAVLREAQKMQAIGQLTGGIAHDFNNLLTVILGNLEITRAKLADQPAIAARLERATWAAQRGATLTAQLLAFARKQPLAPAPIDLAATVPEIVPLLRRTLGEHIDVRYVETAGLWPALADAAQLESAVLNLALNARDAMPTGGRLTIELANKVLDDDYARRHAEVIAGDYAMLAVSDTGHGMTPDVIARIFEPFFTTKPDGKGTGLGLAMVFGFVKQSGGHIKVYSEPGDGTTVRLYLPRAPGAAPPSAQRSGPPIALPRGTATILVVEDEPAVREVAVAILAELGYRVLEAGDGEEGLRVFGAHAGEVDLLLTDVVLPGKLRGREIAERITAIRPEIRVLFMSGYTENAIVHHGRLDEGVQLIGKPFKREQLARKVAEIVGTSETGPNVVELKPRRGN